MYSWERENICNFIYIYIHFRLWCVLLDPCFEHWHVQITNIYVRLHCRFVQEYDFCELHVQPHDYTLYEMMHHHPKTHITTSQAWFEGGARAHTTYTSEKCWGVSAIIHQWARWSRHMGGHTQACVETWLPLLPCHATTCASVGWKRKSVCSRMRTTHTYIHICVYIYRYMYIHAFRDLLICLHIRALQLHVHIHRSLSLDMYIYIHKYRYMFSKSCRGAWSDFEAAVATYPHSPTGVSLPLGRPGASKIIQGGKSKSEWIRNQSLASVSINEPRHGLDVSTTQINESTHTEGTPTQHEQMQNRARRHSDW